MLHAVHRIGLPLVAVIAFCACRSHPASQAAATASPPREVAAAAAPAQASARAQPAPAVRVTASTGADGALAVSVRNHAAEAVELAPALRLERADEHGFERATDVALALSAGASCVRLAPGAELRPAAAPSQRPGASGTYRVVLSGCEDSYRVDSEPFELR